jgi:uncharacterized protein YoxC
MSPWLSWVIGLSVIAVVVLLAIGMKEVRSTNRALQKFIESTQDHLDHTVTPTLQQMKEVLQSVKRVVDDVAAVTGDVKAVSASAREIGQNIHEVSESIKSMTGIVETVKHSATAEARCLTAGLRAASQSFMKTLLYRQ